MQTLSTSVQANGAYSADVLTELTDGIYTVTATVADAASNESNSSDSGSIDTAAPTLTVDVPNNTNDRTPKITGTTNEPENSVVFMLVTDANGIEQVLSATVLANGSYSVDVPNDLAEGSYTIRAST